MFDLSLSTPDFSSTIFSVTANTENGKNFLAGFFGNGAVSAEMPKSSMGDFMVYVQRKGLTII